MKIVIRQVPNARPARCQVWHGDVLHFAGGRVEAKRAARELHEQTGDPVFNVKSNGLEVRVDDTYEPKQAKPISPDFLDSRS